MASRGAPGRWRHDGNHTHLGPSLHEPQQLRVNLNNNANNNNTNDNNNNNNTLDQIYRTFLWFMEIKLSQTSFIYISDQILFKWTNLK